MTSTRIAPYPAQLIDKHAHGFDDRDARIATGRNATRNAHAEGPEVGVWLDGPDGSGRIADIDDDGLAYLADDVSGAFYLDVDGRLLYDGETVGSGVPVTELTKADVRPGLAWMFHKGRSWTAPVVSFLIALPVFETRCPVIDSGVRGTRRLGSAA